MSQNVRFQRWRKNKGNAQRRSWNVANTTWPRTTTGFARLSEALAVATKQARFDFMYVVEVNERWQVRHKRPPSHHYRCRMGQKAQMFIAESGLFRPSRVFEVC